MVGQLFDLRLPSYPTGFIFGQSFLCRWNRSGLFWVHPNNSHCPVLTVEECWKNRTHNPKTDILVAVGGIVVVAVGSATVRRIIVPRAAPFTDACPKRHFRGQFRLEWSMQYLLMINGRNLKKI
jgi:hypothetical protein